MSHFYFAIGMTLVSASILLFIKIGSEVFETKKERDLKAQVRAAKKERDRLRAERKQAASETSHELPTSTPQVEENSTRTVQGPIHYKGRWYASLQKAAQYLRMEPARLLSSLDTSNQSDDEFSLWSSPADYPVAVSHRCHKIGRSSKRLVISDYRGGISSAYVKSGSSRVALDLSVTTGATGDVSLLEEAQTLVASR